MIKAFRRLLHLLNHRRRADELAEELSFHHEARRRELEASGLTPVEAEYAARRAMGSRTLAREDARAVWIWSWLESIWQDAAYALRNLRRHPLQSRDARH